LSNADKEQLALFQLRSWLTNTRIVCKEVNKTIDDIVIRACKWIMEVILHDNMFSSLNIGFATWVASGKVGEESLSIFSNRGMVCGCTCEAGT